MHNTPSPEHKGLITDEEYDMLVRLVRDLPICQNIVEAGAFLGLSTKALIEGIKARDDINETQRRSILHSYDKFEYGAWVHPRFIPRGILQKGESFFPYFAQNLGDDLAYVTTHQGDIIEIDSWKYGKIDLLFLDICKTPKINDKVQNLFFPHLAKNALLIQQDYISSTLNIWIYAALKKLENYFERVEYCQFNSVVYRCIKQIDEDALEKASVCNMSHSERIALAEEVMEEWDDIYPIAAEQIQYAILNYKKAVAMNRYGIRPVKREAKTHTSLYPNLPYNIKSSVKKS